MKTQIQKLIAEFLGTMLLTLGVFATIRSMDGGATTFLVIGLVLTVLVYIFGSVSGAHLNPAVTVGLWSIKKVTSLGALKYIGTQLAGGLAAFLVLKSFGFPMDFKFVNNIDAKVMLGEALGTMILMLGVTTVVLNRTSSKLSGVVIGLALTLGLLVAALGNTGALNIAVALGLGSLNFSIIFGTLLGGVLGANVMKALED